MKLFAKTILCALCAMAITACNDDSSTSPTNNESVSSSENAETGASSTEEVQIISLDESSQTIQTRTISSKNICIADDDTSHFSMQKIDLESVEETTHYEFIGDTLVLFDYDSSTNSIDSSDGLLWIGGKAGTLQGSWKSLPCTYQDDRNDCNYIGSPFETRMDIQDKIYQETVLAPFDFSRSTLSFRIIRYFLFTDKTFSPADALTGEKRFDVDLPDDISQMQNISLTKGSFATPYQTVEYSYDNIVVNEQNISYSLSVSTNGTTCTLNYEITEPDERTCTDSNKPNYVLGVIPANLNKQKTTFLYAGVYQNSNFDEFKNCLDSVIIRNN